MEVCVNGAAMEEWNWAWNEGPGIENKIIRNLRDYSSSKSWNFV